MTGASETAPWGQDKIPAVGDKPVLTALLQKLSAESSRPQDFKYPWP